jgi:DNA-binding CsgD family transcriptional regulator/ketosteroid isomerase-like protein
MVLRADGEDHVDTRTAIVDRWFGAWDQRDIDELLRIAHPDIEVIPENPLLPQLPGTSFRGHVGLRTLALLSFEDYPRLRVDESAIRDARGVIAASAAFVLDEASRPVTKRHTDTLFDVRLGLIRRAWVFPRGSPKLQAAQAGSVLTPREREVFQLLARGMTAPQIAAELFIAPATVRTHVQNGIGRLGAKTRVQAILIALNQGEIEA